MHLFVSIHLWSQILNGNIRGSAAAQSMNGFINCNSWKLISIERLRCSEIKNGMTDNSISVMTPMRPKFMYAKYFLSSKNWKHKYFISLSFYKAKLGGRVAQVMPENCPHSNSRAWKQISLKPMCNVMSMQIFHFPNEPPLSLSAVWLLRLSQRRKTLSSFGSFTSKVNWP